MWTALRRLLGFHSAVGGGEADVKRDMTEFEFWSRHCLAGGVSAAVSKTATAPLDRIKMHMQVHNEGGFRAAVRHVYGERGARGFWRGNGLNVLKSSPEFAVKWSVYDYVKRRLMDGRHDGRLDSLDRFAAGAAAGVCGHALLYPIETVRTRLTVRDHASVADAVARTYRAGGPSAFFRGFWPSTVTVFLYTGIELTAYERLKQRLGPAAAAPGPRESQWPVNLASALCSSAAGVVACYPISTIITRLQADDGTIVGTAADGLKRRATEFRGLYRGFVSSFVKTLPAVSVSYAVYEEMCKYFGVRMS